MGNKNKLDVKECVIFFTGLEQIRLGIKTLGRLTKMPNSDIQYDYNLLLEVYERLNAEVLKE